MCVYIIRQLGTTNLYIAIHSFQHIIFWKTKSFAHFLQASLLFVLKKIICDSAHCHLFLKANIDLHFVSNSVNQSQYFYKQKRDDSKLHVLFKIRKVFCHES